MTDGGPAADDRAREEWALVARVQSGDGAAYDVLVRRYMRQAFAVAYRLLENRADAEDLVQDAFVAALEAIDGFEAGRPFGPWLLRIVANRGLNARKARSIRRTDPIPEGATSHEASPDRAAETGELAQALRAALDGMDERRATIVRLCELEGLSSVETGAILNLADGTVRWHLHEARSELRRVLDRFAPSGTRKVEAEEETT